jgi:hypothetical protein
MSETQKIMIAREEGGTWEIIPIHSIVIHGMRWDAKNEEWADYPFTVEDIEANQGNEGWWK